MKIVQFSDGKYAIRKYNLAIFTYEYLDLNSPRYWWSGANKVVYYDSITSDNLERVKSFYAQVCDKGKEVKSNE